MGSVPRVVVVTRPTDLQALLVRHATKEQARFFLSTRGQKWEDLEARHARFEATLHQVLQAIPSKWRRATVSRGDLPRFVFEPEDFLVAVGQDGLVANLAKYTEGQLVFGVNPDPQLYEGILVPLRAGAARRLLERAAAGRSECEERVMVEAQLDDGQRLRALNEIFVGHRSHQSARYRVRWGERQERQSSSGLVVATGTGATGWAKSIFRHRVTRVVLPKPAEPRLAFFVREAWPSVATGAELTDGALGPGEVLEATSEMNEGGVLFGDGIEDDRLEFAWGMTARIRIAETRLRLVRG